MSDASARLRATAKALPRTPGVYRFRDARGGLLYVGKARSLRDRVGSYFQAGDKAPRTRLMLATATAVEVTLTPSEDDALLLEQEQIKALKPRHNVLFRDDKSYPYLRLSHHDFPRLCRHRGPPGADCHGPFPNGWAVRESISVLQKAFRLRTCTDAVLANRTRPCLLHQIGRCSAPCVGHADARDYAGDAAAARAFLAGDANAVTTRLTARMEAAAERQEYEEAARLRDSLNALAEVRRSSAVTGGAREADFVALHHGDGGWAVRLAAVRGGRLVAELDRFPANAADADAAEVLTAFLSQHYARHRPPARIVTNGGGAPATLARLAGAGVTVITHPRGPERERLEMAVANAANALKAHAAAGTAAAAALEALGEALGTSPPRTVDCFDVSHSMGEEAVAACVTCVDGAMDTSGYRRYRLRTTPAGDDYAGMGETLRRRYRPPATGAPAVPDLVVIDGGAGQVAVARAALAEVGAPSTPLLGIAKGPGRKPGLETLVTGEGEVIELKPTSAAFRLLLRMRDEAHRFALAGHRKRRDRKRRGSVLEDVEGVGPARRRQLINAFGGLQGLRRASPRDLSRINGVGPELARRIFQALHS